MCVFQSQYHILYKVNKVNNKVVNASYPGKVLAGTKHSKSNRGTSGTCLEELKEATEEPDSTTGAPVEINRGTFRPAQRRDGIELYAFQPRLKI